LVRLISLPAVPRASGPVFMFCAPGRVFGGTEGVGSHFHILRARTSFRRYRGRRIPFLCFALLKLIPVIPRASGPVFIFCAPGLFFGGTEGVRSLFHILHALTRFRRYRGHHVPFSYFALQDSFSAVPRASGPVFMFCAPILVFGGAEGVGSRFHVLRARAYFWWYRGCWVQFSCSALPSTFLAVPRASGLDFIFCSPGLVFGGTEGVRSHFHVLRARTSFRR
jgi:hypothetical protein